MRTANNDELKAAYAQAKDKAHGCTVYTGSDVYHATISGQRSANASAEYMRLMGEMKLRGLPL